MIEIRLYDESRCRRLTETSSSYGPKARHHQSSPGGNRKRSSDPQGNTLRQTRLSQGARKRIRGPSQVGEDLATSRSGDVARDLQVVQFKGLHLNLLRKGSPARRIGLDRSAED